jgi:hypothetical protein
MAVHESTEEPLGPIRVNTSPRRIEFLHVTPDTCPVLGHWNLESRHSFVGDVGDVLDVVEECDIVMITPEQQNLPVKIYQAIKRRVVPEGVVPWLCGEEIVDLPSPRNEPRNVAIHP